MLITKATLDPLFVTFSQLFADAYMSEPQPLLTEIGSRIPSGSRDQIYPFTQAISGAMREWLGERKVQNVVLQGFRVANKKFEDTLSILREDIEDDQYGAYTSMLIPNLARNAKLLPDKEIAAMILANPVGFDELPFFDANHPKDPSGLTPGVQSNDLATGPLNNVNLAAVQAAMMSFKGPDNQPMGCYGDTILVPPSLKYTADTLANAVFYPTAQNGVGSVFGAQTNVWRGQYKVVSSPWLEDTGDPATATWYLLDCRYANMRPFFWQEREAAQLVQMVDPSNPAVFFQDTFYMGARARGAAAPALWFKAIRVTP